LPSGKISGDTRPKSASVSTISRRCVAASFASTKVEPGPAASRMAARCSGETDGTIINGV
jgi:hypothetical protein